MKNPSYSTSITFHYFVRKDREGRAWCACEIVGICWYFFLLCTIFPIVSAAVKTFKCRLSSSPTVRSPGPVTVLCPVLHRCGVRISGLPVACSSSGQLLGFLFYSWRYGDFYLLCCSCMFILWRSYPMTKTSAEYLKILWTIFLQVRFSLIISWHWIWNAVREGKISWFVCTKF